MIMLDAKKCTLAATIIRDMARSLDALTVAGGLGNTRPIYEATEFERCCSDLGVKLRAMLLPYFNTRALGLKWVGDVGMQFASIERAIQRISVVDQEHAIYEIVNYEENKSTYTYHINVLKMCYSCLWDLIDKDEIKVR